MAQALTCARHLAQVRQLLGNLSSKKEQLDFQSTSKFRSHQGPTLTFGVGLLCSKKATVQGPSQLILVVSQIQLLRKRFGLENITQGNVLCGAVPPLPAQHPASVPSHTGLKCPGLGVRQESGWRE